LSEEEAKYSLGMKFLDESEPFCYGFEAGMIYKELKLGKDVLQRTLHTINKEQFEEMAKSFEMQFIVDQQYEGEHAIWMVGSFVPKANKQIKNHLTLVSENKVDLNSNPLVDLES
jgi:hypothetical protein